MQQLLPSFLQLLSGDYGRWASGASSQGQAREKEAPVGDGLLGDARGSGTDGAMAAVAAAVVLGGESQAGGFGDIKEREMMSGAPSHHGGS